MECTACHIDEEDYELRSEDYNELCNRCHAEKDPGRDHHPIRAVPEQMEVPEDWPLQEGKFTCLTCHTPSHDEYIGVFMFLRANYKPRPENFKKRISILILI